MTNDTTNFEFAGIVSHDPDAHETVVLYRRPINETKDEFRHVTLDSTTDTRVVEFPKTPTKSMNVVGGEAGTDE